MKISNHIYLSQPFHPDVMAGVSLAKSDDNSYEYLNEPTIGYIPVRFEKNRVYLRHPTLDFLAAMDANDFIDTSIKAHCSEALLVFNDEGRLQEYDPDNMTIEVRHDPRMYEHRWIRKNHRPLQAEEGLRYFVQSINYTTKKATILDVAYGNVSRDIVRLDDLLSNWEIVPVPLSSNLIHTFTQSVKPNTKFQPDTVYLPENPIFSIAEGLRYPSGMGISGFGPIIAETAQSQPLLVYSEYYSSKDGLTVVHDGMRCKVSQPALMIHSSLIAKHWDTLPIRRYKFWRDSVHLEAKNTLGEEYSAYKPSGCDPLPLTVGNSLEIYATVNIANHIFHVYILLKSYVNFEGATGILREVSIRTGQPISTDLQRAVLRYINTFLNTDDHIITQTVIEDGIDQSKISMGCFVPCELTVESVEAIHRAVFERINGAISLEIRLVRVPFLKKGAKHAVSISVPTLTLSTPHDYHTEELKRYLLRTPN